MTVAELIVWLQTQDQGATVQVVRHTSGQSYYDQGGNAAVEDFTLEPIAPYTNLFEYTNILGNPYATFCCHQRTLLLGAING